ncbi:hypothetical protein A3715_05045 [Oleiphilus sp. HI0009]|nr:MULTISPECIES: tetratricopeptide repeat-containing response regulator [unclassified Oleiphilus]KZX83468.1 hypothetical protein A3715_05045 [Oleiphilus sp. HI0009]KZY65054.1 hypothetical protein A3738_09340 [Oleiphilus sp. HI0066]KZY71411.1 hypothetical protein A3739_04890 [Oleiphilus sp. HI0067]MCH2159456.1 response regulator [Oleiphilaceae bacterium]
MTVSRQVQLAKYYRNLRFLIIDDFENFRLSIKQMVRAFGVEQIDVAINGEDAISRCEKEEFDIIICDYNLGDGKNGQQVLEELRYNKLLKHTGIFVMVTAETSKDMVMGALEYLPDGYITKPLTKSVLQERMDRLIEQSEVLKPINAAIDEGDSKKAIALLGQEIKRETRYILWCLRTLANLYYHEGEMEKARKIYNDVLTKRDIGWARLGLGRVKAAVGEVEGAVDDFTQVLDVNPNVIEAYDELADAYLSMNQPRDAQRTLEDAVGISPHAYNRQQKLAEVCTDNRDIEGAAGAYKASMKLGFHSVHDKPENYLNLGRCLSDMADGDTSELGKKRAKEAVQVMGRVAKKFKDDPTVRMNAALIEARTYQGQGDHRKSDEIFAKAKKLISDQELDSATQLEYARTLYSMGETEEAEGLLSSLAAAEQDNASMIKSINELIDEPVGLQAKVRARKLNKTGIKSFESGDLEAAIESFNDALECTPKHPALNLNIVQVTLKMIETQGALGQLVSRCTQCLENVAHIPEQHSQYKRYQFLQKKVAAL